jgi:hypothetical protein
MRVGAGDEGIQRLQPVDEAGGEQVVERALALKRRALAVAAQRV